MTDSRKIKFIQSALSAAPLKGWTEASPSVADECFRAEVGSHPLDGREKADQSVSRDVAPQIDVGVNYGAPNISAKIDCVRKSFCNYNNSHSPFPQIDQSRVAQSSTALSVLKISPGSRLTMSKAPEKKKRQEKMKPEHKPKAGTTSNHPTKKRSASKRQEKAKNGPRPPWNSFPDSFRQEVEGPLQFFFTGASEKLQEPCLHVKLFPIKDTAFNQLKQALWTALAALQANHDAIEAKKARIDEGKMKPGDSK